MSGWTGQRIVRAILAGERDPATLAALSHPGIHATRDTIAKSLDGTWQPDLVFVLHQEVAMYDVYQQRIAECDHELEQHLKGFGDKVADSAADGEPSPTIPRQELRSGPKRRRKAGSHAPQFDLAPAAKLVLHSDRERILTLTMRQTTAVRQIAQRYAHVRESLNERARRLFVASEAVAYGYGGIAMVARATGVAPRTIGGGITELQQIEGGWIPPWGQTRVRKPGAGRKTTTWKDPTLLSDLQALVEATTRGDPESPLLWTARSQRNLVAALVTQGHQTSMKMVARLLKEMGYSLQANRKTPRGRAASRSQRAVRAHQRAGSAHAARRGEPVISVDTKKKELVGDFKNAGRELCAQGRARGRATCTTSRPGAGQGGPYGVYDLRAERGVGQRGDRSTTRPSSRSRRSARGGTEMGPPAYPARARRCSSPPTAAAATATALRLWKVELQGSPTRLGLAHRRLSLPARDEQVEQDRAPPVLVHHAELARQTPHHAPGDREPHRRHDDDDRLVGPLPTRRTQLSQGPPRVGRAARARELGAACVPRRVELHHSPDGPRMRMRSANFAAGA